MKKKSSGAGERTARTGLRYQDRASAILAYQALLEGKLSFIALADDQAGMFDDLVIGISGQVVGHQYKSSTKPKPVGVNGLLLGTDVVIADCAASFKTLEAAFPRKFIKVKYVTSHFPSTNDKGRFGVADQDSADFFREMSLFPERSLDDWQASIWRPIIDELLIATGMTEPEFERFFSRFEITFGAAKTIELNPALDPAIRSQIVELALILGDLVGRDDGKTRWSRRELLDELGWPDRLQSRFEHRFPLGAHIQSNEKTELDIENSLVVYPSGYLCLLGPPGTGKSTLLERFVRSSPSRIVLRYLAYVPGTAQKQGRGEAVNFLADLNSQLVGSGLLSKRVKDDTLEQLRETFEKLLTQAAERYVTKGRRTIIVVDGLDHVPREEKPEMSFLRVLPLPQSVAQGIVFILGSQRIDLAEIPREVKDQASSKGRRIEICPLTEAAVGEMIGSKGLCGAVHTSDIYSVTLGHPLVTQYLLGKLLDADAEERQALIAGGFEYDGDLEKVYLAAWREAEEADIDVSKVLFTLSFAEGRIEPDILAQCLSREAVNRTFKIAHHLIDHTKPGWQVFHNSFRLFLRQQTIELYGKPDPEFSEVALYSRLADLAKSAHNTSVQRWLEFRYRWLAGDLVKAAAISSRVYFIGQFMDGRPSYDLSNDIRDAFASVAQDQSPARVFDLMLAKDEVSRRQEALNMSSDLVAAQVAAGELDIAEAQLSSSHRAGDEWIVIRALLDEGQLDRARAIFDDVDPMEWLDGGYSSGSEGSLETWAEYAVVLLDYEQIQRRIRKPVSTDKEMRSSFSGERYENYMGDMHVALARSTLRHASHLQVEEVAERFEIKSNTYAKLHLDLAESKFAASDGEGALNCLRDYESCCDVDELHGSWHLEAASLAHACGDPELAAPLIARVEIPNLCGLEFQSESIGEAVRYVVRFSAVSAKLGKLVPLTDLPTELLFRGIQNYAVQLGTMIGKLKAEHSPSPTIVSKLVRASLRFLAGAVPGPADDVLLGYRLRYADEPLIEAICEIVRLVPEVTPAFAAEFESCLKLPICAFRESIPVCRKFTKTMFDFDGDSASAVARIEVARRKVKGSRSPHEAIDRLSVLSLTYGEIGMKSRAQEMLHEIRDVSFGSYLAAKKEGQYHLWVDLLVAANQKDPDRATTRSFMMLQFIAGIENSEADDQAARISKTVLVEAISSSSASAWDAFHWAIGSGMWQWNALIDAVARGMVRRQPDLVIPLAITWTALGLPYYCEAYNSVTRPGEFLRELVAATPVNKLAEIQRIIVSGLERDSKPADRPKYLRVFRDALADRGEVSELVSEAVTRWNAEPAFEDDALPDYYELKSLDDIEFAVAKEREFRKAKTSVHFGDFVNVALAKRIARIIVKEAWSDVEPFVTRNHKLVMDWPVRQAVAKVAIGAGQSDFAENLLLSDEQEHEGWGGWAARGKITYHRARHLLAKPDAYECARNDFIRDLTVDGYGTGSALWGVGEIFPLLYNDIDWTVLWDLLAEQIEGHRDYRKVNPVQQGSEATNDDIDLIARLYLEAMNFGVLDPLEQAEDGLLELIRRGENASFCCACSQLIEGEGFNVLFGSRLLLDSQDNECVAAVFGDQVSSLSAHEDVCVAAIGHILCQKWGKVALALNADFELPPIYTLELPPIDERNAGSLRDVELLGPMTDDPAAWTEGFEHWVDALAGYSGVSTSNIRFRVAQLISSWGGIAVHGMKAAERLEKHVTPLGLRLPFVRPHIAICFRALHVVVGELWRASKLSEINADILLHRLAGGPVLPPRDVCSTRPIDITWPLQLKDPFKSDAKEWINAEDMKRHSPLGHVVGEWARLCIFESGSNFCEEMLAIRGATSTSANGLVSAIKSLPKSYWGQGRIVTSDESTCTSLKLRNLKISVVGKRPEAFMFDPVFAQFLGWHQSTKKPFSFVNKDNNLMVTTRFWRDGWQQEANIGSTFRWAYGQRVELTEAGQVAIEELDGLPLPITTIWRTFNPGSKKESSTSCWSNEDSPP